MAVPHTSGNFGDLLDPRFQQIFDNELRELPDNLPGLFDFVPTNNREDMRWSGVGAFGDWDQFTGTVDYDSQAQAFDTTSIPIEFASGMQIERKLFDDDQYNIMDQRPQGLSQAYVRTRQKHGARIFNNAFSTDTFFYNNSEGVALCSNSHLTNATGVSTAIGFDNLGTAALSATAVTAARILMRKFRDDRGNRISVIPDELLYPIDLTGVAQEIMESVGKLDTANNNINVERARYRTTEWEYLTDTNDWFMMDSAKRRMWLKWVDRISVEFAFAEDLDTLIAKWRGYARYSNAWLNWRFIFGAQVS